MQKCLSKVGGNEKGIWRRATYTHSQTYAIMAVEQVIVMMSIECRSEGTNTLVV